MRAIDSVHILPLLGPVSTTSVLYTDVVNLKNYHAIKFLFPVGALAVNLTITVLKSTTAAKGATAAIAFRYRKTSAVDTDTVGAWAWATTSGIALVASTDNNLIFEALVESSELTPVSTTEYPFVYAAMTPASSAACVISALGILEPRYAQAVPPSAVT